MQARRRDYAYFALGEGGPRTRLLVRVRARWEVHPPRGQRPKGDRANWKATRHTSSGQPQDLINSWVRWIVRSSIDNRGAVW
jgi:hypothetical protein